MRHSAVGWPRHNGERGKTLVGVRMENDLLDALDGWIVERGGTLSRQDAIKQIVARQIGA
jgi:metal-responsive CopG/Arc/MetJ family transcriptional regulator